MEVPLVFPASLNISTPELNAICEKHGVKELAVFGSALRSDFARESDTDFLVQFLDEGSYGPWMEKLAALEVDLALLVGRPVDLSPKNSLKWVIQDEVLASAETVYVAPG